MRGRNYLRDPFFCLQISELEQRMARVEGGGGREL